MGQNIVVVLYSTSVAVKETFNNYNAIILRQYSNPQKSWTMPFFIKRPILKTWEIALPTLPLGRHPWNDIQNVQQTLLLCWSINCERRHSFCRLLFGFLSQILLMIASIVSSSVFRISEWRGNPRSLFSRPFSSPSLQFPPFLSHPIPFPFASEIGPLIQWA